MGVLTMEMEKVNKTLEKNQKKVDELEKKLNRERKEKEKLKEYNKDIMKAVELDCYNYLKNEFDEQGYEKACINLQLTTIRNEIIKKVGTTTVEKQYLEQNYEKIFAKVKKIFENDKKAKNQIENIELQEKLKEEQIAEEKENRFIRICNAIGFIIKWSLIILFAPIVLLFIFISICAKGR